MNISRARLTSIRIFWPVHIVRRIRIRWHIGSKQTKFYTTNTCFNMRFSKKKMKILLFESAVKFSGAWTVLYSAYVYVYVLVCVFGTHSILSRPFQWILFFYLRNYKFTTRSFFTTEKNEKNKIQNRTPLRNRVLQLSK